MAKVHNLDIYPHTGDSSCLGCVEETDETLSPDGEAGGAASTAASAETAGTGEAAEPETAPAPEEPPPGAEHLIEVQVVDVAGLPRSNVQYEITLPDGSTRGGATAADGFIRLSVAPHTGEFTLVLPDFERLRP